MFSYVEPKARSGTVRLLQGIVFALASVVPAAATAICKPLMESLREGNALGPGVTPGILIILSLIGATVLGIRYGWDRTPIVAATGCICAAIGLDFLPYSPIRSAENIVVAAAALIVYATFRIGSAERLNPFIKLMYSLIGAFVLEIYMFNATSQYETMHIFGGGEQV